MKGYSFMKNTLFVLLIGLMMTGHWLIAETPKPNPLQSSGVQKMEVVNDTPYKLDVTLPIIGKEGHTVTSFQLEPREKTTNNPTTQTRTYTKDEYGQEVRVAKQGSIYGIGFKGAATGGYLGGAEGTVKYGVESNHTSPISFKVKFELIGQGAKMTITSLEKS